MNEVQYIVSISAVIISALLAVILTKTVDYFQNKRKERVEIFKTLISCFHDEVSYRKTEALNLIKVIFYGCDDVMIAYNNYMELFITNSSYTPEQTQEKWVLLLEQIAKCLKYKNITWDMLKKTYKPIGLVNYEQTQQESAQFYNMFLKMLVSSPELLKSMQPSFNKYVPPLAESHQND